jgi:hypothetical protein
VTQAQTKTLTGKCLCGAVRFSASGPFEHAEACHCSQCARWTGSFFVSTTVRRSDLNFLNNDTLKWFNSSATGRRGFCTTCGSSLFWERVGGEEIDILAGSLDQPSGLRIVEHIFVADKADFVEIPDDVRQHPGSRTNE